MSWVQATLEEFCRSIGADGIGFDADGVAAFEADDGAILAIREPGDAGDDVVVSLTGPRARGEDVAHRLLAQPDFRRGFPWQVQAWAEGHEMALAVRIPAPSFVLASLDEAVAGLFRMHESIGGGGALP